MSKADTPATTEAEPDVVKNLKAEMNRKMDNVAAELAEQRKISEALLAKLNTKPTTATTETKEQSLSDLFYSDPDKYAQAIETRTTAAIEARMAKQQRQVNVINQLAQEYPEANDQQHPLYKTAVEKYNALPDEEKTSPAAYRAAVAEAALELGIKPRSKRTETDEYTMPSGGSRPRGRPKADTPDPMVIETARLMGLDVEDKEVVKRLAQKQNRNWGRYEKVSK